MSPRNGGVEDVVLIGRFLQQRRQKFRGIAGGAEGNGADEPVAAGHQRVGAGIKQQIDDLVVTVVFGRRLLEFYGAMQRTVVVRRLGFDVRIGAVLQQERHGVCLSGVAGIHYRLPVCREGLVFVEHVAHGIEVAALGGGGECFCGFYCGLLLDLALSLGEQQQYILGFVVGQFIARSSAQNAGKGGRFYQNDGKGDFVAGSPTWLMRQRVINRDTIIHRLRIKASCSHFLHSSRRWILSRTNMPTDIPL